MKFFSISTLTGLFALASAAFHTQHVDVVCTDADPTTVTQTVTVYGGSNKVTDVPNPAPYVTTVGGSVTSIDYYGSRSSVWVYPTGSPDHDCTVAIYENNVFITVIIVNINVSLVNGVTKTITSTVTGAQPTWTPKPPQTASYTPIHTSVLHNVIVGINGDLKYGGSQIDAAIGDIIRFDFNSTNHTVTQSDFNTPCEPKAGGFNTGFNQFNPTNHTGIKLIDFEVKISTPLWFYCAQNVKVSHCHKGMVLGVNPAGKFPEFLNKATATTLASTSIPLPIGSNKPSSSYISKPYSTGNVKVPLSTSYPSKTTGPVVPSQPTATGIYYRVRGRRAAQWYA